MTQTKYEFMERELPAAEWAKACAAAQADGWELLTTTDLPAQDAYRRIGRGKVVMVPGERRVLCRFRRPLP